MPKPLPETMRARRHPMFGKVPTRMADNGTEYFGMRTACRIFNVTGDRMPDLAVGAGGSKPRLRDMAGGEGRAVNAPGPVIEGANLPKRTRRAMAKKRAASKKRNQPSPSGPEGPRRRHDGRLRRPVAGGSR